MQASLSLGTQIPTGLSFPLGVCSARHPWGGPSWSSGWDQWSLGLSWLQPFHLQAIITSLLLLLPRLWFRGSSNPESFSPHKSNHLRARTPLTRLGSPNSRRRDKALSANHLFWRWFQEALNAEWAMEQKLMGGASVTAPGGWTPPTGGNSADYVPCLGVGPPQGGESWGVSPPPLSITGGELVQGPLIPGVQLAPAAEQGWRQSCRCCPLEATNCDCQSPLPASVPSWHSRRATENPPTLERIQGGLCHGETALVRKSFPGLSPKSLQTSTFCSSSDSWGEKGLRHIFQRHLNNYTGTSASCTR